MWRVVVALQFHHECHRSLQSALTHGRALLLLARGCLQDQPGFVQLVLCLCCQEVPLNHGLTPELVPELVLHLQGERHQLVKREARCRGNHEGCVRLLDSCEQAAAVSSVVSWC
mmetsp:Transcript_18456/g.36192  ORF Transcript_18456/g.36192 Transcript_18456/m.36192 type:complete len:114 (+) Transcript_18456:414-755(+)